MPNNECGVALVKLSLPYDIGVATARKEREQWLCPSAQPDAAGHGMP